MGYDKGFGEWVRDHLADLGPIDIRPMFGAAGVKFAGAMFAILDDGEVWLKADAALAAELEAEGARRFTYRTKAGEEMVMAYWSLPASATDDADEAVAWARRAVEVALRPKVKSARSKPLP